METVLRFISDRKILLLLDNCEHLLDICGETITTLLNGCPRLTILATSRETVSVAGEITWRVPSLSVNDEAVSLFIDRARRARPTFRATGDDADLVADICRRLDGMPLAIELAAARVRALSLRQIADSLNDRFRLLTGGARNAMRRQQTLRASVDWSHALLTDAERTLFRRLGVFMGGFDLDAAQSGRSHHARPSSSRSSTSSACWSTSRSSSPTTSRESCAIACSRRCGSTRSRSSAESGEADEVRDRHRDHYVAAAVSTEARRAHWSNGLNGNRQLFGRRTRGVSTKRNSRRRCGFVSSLQRLWVNRGRMLKASPAFDAVFTDGRYRDADVATRIWVRAQAR